MRNKVWGGGCLNDVDGHILKINPMQNACSNNFKNHLRSNLTSLIPIGRESNAIFNHSSSCCEKFFITWIKLKNGLSVSDFVGFSQFTF